MVRSSSNRIDNRRHCFMDRFGAYWFACAGEVDSEHEVGARDTSKRIRLMWIRIGKISREGDLLRAADPAVLSEVQAGDRRINCLTIASFPISLQVEIVEFLRVGLTGEE